MAPLLDFAILLLDYFADIVARVLWWGRLNGQLAVRVEPYRDRAAESEVTPSRPG